MRTLDIRLSEEHGAFDRFANLCVGAGRAHEVLRAGFVRQMETVVRECGFRYLRFHGLFCDDMAVVTRRADGTLRYNWQYIDEIFDEMLAQGIRPFVELSFTPKAMASGEKTVFWWKGNITPPRDYAEYSDFIHAAVSHWEARYGRAEVEKWFFEVWNEPDLGIFFTGTMDEYFKIYDSAARAVKAVSESYRVGGPATSEHHWIDEFIAHCVENNIPVDFLSTHTYGVEGAIDEFGRDLHVLLDDPDYIPSSVAATRAKIEKTALAGIPLYYTEWSCSYSSRDNLHDSYVNAPFILYNLKRLAGKVQAMSYWTFTDIFEEAGPPPTPFHGGFGLMNMHGLKKPTYFAYKFLNMLGGTELQNDDPDSIVCKSEQGVQALVWNYTKHDQQNVPNELYYIRDLVPGDAEPARLSIPDLPDGRYLVSVYRTGYGVNDVYGEYLKLGRPDNLSREQIAALAQTCDGTPECHVEVVKQGFSMDLPLRENDVYFVDIKKI